MTGQVSLWKKEIYAMIFSIIYYIWMEFIMMRIKFVLLMLLVLSLTACGGGGAKVQTTTSNTTMGQELMDLNDSYKKGILTEKEYKNAKENIMDRYDN